jgi:hypothetical protein
MRTVEQIIAEFEKHDIWETYSDGQKAKLIACEIEQDLEEVGPKETVKLWDREFEVPAGTIDWDMLYSTVKAAIEIN